MLKPKQVDEIFQRFSENKPDPKIELNYFSPFTLLIAVILSAQATDKGVNRVTPKLFEIASTPEQIIELGEGKLKELIKSIGLYNSKARNIVALSKILVQKYNNTVPSTMQDLSSLPGVGRKSANVILNCIFQQPTIAVDTHIFRVANRIGLTKTNTPEKTEAALMKVVPNKWKPLAHFWLVLHGRYVCKARKPECASCIINDICQYKTKIL